MKKIVGLFFGAAMILSMPFLAFGQEEKIHESELGDMQEMVTIADVNFTGAKIISQEGNNIKISFSMDNRFKSQSDILYAVKLKRNIGEDNIAIVDEKIFDEVLSIDKGQIIKKEITYSAPKFLAGEYELMLQAETQAGLVLSFYDLGSISLVGDNKFVELKDCRLLVEGETGSKEYFANEGIDILADENIIVRCKAENHFTENVTVRPNFENRLRSSFGIMVEDDNKAQADINLNGMESRVVDIKADKGLKPQAYEGKLYLMGANNEVSSNAVSFHYVVNGESATVNNVSLDKSSYQKEQIAKITVMSSMSAGNFIDARLPNVELTDLFLDMEISNQSGESCITPIAEKRLKVTDGILDFNEKIIKDCDNPGVLVTIKNAQGKVLDQRNFNFKSFNKSEVTETQKDESWMSDKPLMKFLFIIFVIIFIAVIVVSLMKKKDSPKMFIFGTLLAGALFFAGVDSASALTSCSPALTGGYSANGVCAVVNIADEYAPSAPIKSPLHVYVMGCANYKYNGDTYGRINTEAPFYTSIGDYSNLKIGNDKNNPLKVGDFSKTASATPGSYKAEFSIKAYSNCTVAGGGGGDDCAPNKNKSFKMSQTFVVKAAKVDGACDAAISSARKYSAAATDWSGSWCSAGSPEFPNGTPSFPGYGKTTVNWTCKGSNGGADKTDCSASRRFATPSIYLDPSPSNVIFNSSNGMSTGIATGSIDPQKTNLTWRITNFTDACGGNGCACSASGAWSSLEDAPSSVDQTQEVAVNPPIGSGNRTFTIDCQNNTPNLESLMGNMATNVTVGCKDYTSSWSGCDHSCGPGQKTQTVISTSCAVSNNPMGCNEGACPVSSEWKEVRP